jgi:methylmalonyl-CoA mutase C-terminal domain/subunit
MSNETRRIKAIIATLGLETHWRGAVTVAGMLRNQGIEVIYLGNAYPEEVIEAAIQKDVDIVGISTLLGCHLSLGSEVLRIAKEKAVKDRMVFIVGGVFPPNDVPKLRQLGFDGIFGPGMTAEALADFITRAMTKCQEGSIDNITRGTATD